VEFTAKWLDPADVKDQLRISGADVADDDLVDRCCAAVEPQVERARRDLIVYWDPDDPNPPDPPPPGWPVVFTPDAEVYQAAVMLASRLVRNVRGVRGLRVPL
jgi:hypothetical protein